MMAISIRFNDEDLALIRKYAEMKKMTVSELIRQTMLEQIENEFDIKLYEQAMREFLANPVTYSLDEVEKEIGLK